LFRFIAWLHKNNFQPFLGTAFEILHREGQKMKKNAAALAFILFLSWSCSDEETTSFDEGAADQNAPAELDLDVEEVGPEDEQNCEICQDEWFDCIIREAASSDEDGAVLEACQSWLQSCWEEKNLPIGMACPSACTECRGVYLECKLTILFDSELTLENCLERFNDCTQRLELEALPIDCPAE